MLGHLDHDVIRFGAGIDEDEIDEDGTSGLIVARGFVGKDMAERHAMIRRALRSPGSEVTTDEARRTILFALTPAQYLPVAGGFAVLVGWSEWRLGTRRTAIVARLFSATSHR